MTPKEKAKELYNKFNCHVSQRDFFGDNVEHTNTKKCVLIAVDEMLNYLKVDGFSTQIDYWIEVKQEIEDL